MNGFVIGRAAKLIALQEGYFAFDGGLAGAELDPRHQLMRECFQFGPRDILRQIECYPQKAGHDFIQNARTRIEFALVGMDRDRRSGGMKAWQCHPDIHAMQARRTRSGAG